MRRQFLNAGCLRPFWSLASRIFGQIEDTLEIEMPAEQSTTGKEQTEAMKTFFGQDFRGGQVIVVAHANVKGKRKESLELSKN